MPLACSWSVAMTSPPASGWRSRMAMAARKPYALVLVDVGLSLVKGRSPRIERYLDGTPLVIVERGRLLRDRMGVKPLYYAWNGNNFWFGSELKALRAQIASAINIVVQARRLTGGKRKVVSVSEISGMEGELITMHDLFTFEQRGVDEAGHAFGYFRVHGIRPRCADRIEARGLRLPPDLFARRDLETV